MEIIFCLDEKLMKGLAEKSLWSQIPQNIRISKCFQSLCAAKQLLLNQKATILCLLDCLQGSNEPVLTVPEIVKKRAVSSLADPCCVQLVVLGCATEPAAEMSVCPGLTAQPLCCTEPAHTSVFSAFFNFQLWPIQSFR